MIMRTAKLRALHADSPITKRRAFRRTSNDTNMLGHTPILQSPTN